MKSDATKAFESWYKSRVWGSNPENAYELQQAFRAGWKAALQSHKVLNLQMAVKRLAKFHADHP